MSGPSVMRPTMPDGTAPAPRSRRCTDTRSCRDRHAGFRRARRNPESSGGAVPGSARGGRPPDIAQIRCVLLIAAPVSPLLDREPVALIEPLGTHIRRERPQLEPTRPPLLSQREEPGAEPAARPFRIHIQVRKPVTVQDHQAQRRAVISAREPRLLFVNDTSHPVPDLIVRMHQRRNLRNRMMTSAQVYPGRDIRVRTCAPPQHRYATHPPIIAQTATTTQAAPPKPQHHLPFTGSALRSRGSPAAEPSQRGGSGSSSRNVLRNCVTRSSWNAVG